MFVAMCGAVLRDQHTIMPMDGAYKRQRQKSDLMVGDTVEAGAKCQRVQRGVAALGRRGQAMQIRAVAGAGIPAECFVF